MRTIIQEPRKEGFLERFFFMCAFFGCGSLSAECAQRCWDHIAEYLFVFLGMTLDSTNRAEL